MHKRRSRSRAIKLPASRTHSPRLCDTLNKALHTFGPRCLLQRQLENKSHRHTQAGNSFGRALSQSERVLAAMSHKFAYMRAALCRSLSPESCPSLSRACVLSKRAGVTKSF